MATAVTPTASLRTALAAQRAQTLHIKPFACIAAPARQAARFKRCKRGSLQVVAVRVENEEVALGTVAPDFEVKLASTGNVPWCSDDCTDCYSCCPFTDGSAPLFLCTSSAPCRCSSPSALRRPQLPNVVSGQTIKLSEYAAGAPATLVMFLCVHWCAAAAAVPCWCLPCCSPLHLAATMDRSANVDVLMPQRSCWCRMLYLAGCGCMCVRACLLPFPMPQPLPLYRLLRVPARSPFVVHLKRSIAELAREYQARGVKVLAISSNSVETHPQVRGSCTCGMGALLNWAAVWQANPRTVAPACIPHARWACILNQTHSRWRQLDLGGGNPEQCLAVGWPAPAPPYSSWAPHPPARLRR